ncbi:hypothetical protein FFRU_021500 [Fructobacillus fructosus]|nr:hypothetical protein FFRU_021500 [Fructobacillus fructosus]
MIALILVSLEILVIKLTNIKGANHFDGNDLHLFRLTPKLVVKLRSQVIWALDAIQKNGRFTGSTMQFVLSKLDA